MPERYVFNITPIGKPRMTQRDKWKHRPVIDQYYAFKDELNLQARQLNFTLPDQFAIDFYLPMPASWSNKRRLAMDGMPHQQKPDFDNLAKAFTDCLTDDDARVWSCFVQKFWANQGRIEVSKLVIQEAQG